MIGSNFQNKNDNFPFVFKNKFNFTTGSTCTVKDGPARKKCDCKYFKPSFTAG